MSAAAPDPAAQLRAAYVALKQQQARIAELETAQAAAREPIAIVGIGCRFPGGARGPEAFWEQLRAGVDAVREVPGERWAVEEYFDADPERAGKMYARHGGFLEDVDKFDARFFGISPREAATMDPQQRLLLETAWEAFEHAGMPPAGVAGSATGVFVGLTVVDYLKLIYRDDLRRLDTYCATGNVANIAAGRLSYFFGLRGPSMTLDTACSSSLVAVHLACQSLRSGESTMALAAGVNLILAPDNSVALSRARMLAPDGRCKAFDAAADGYARGEGCGVVILKTLTKARADGDRVLAVIRGSAVAQDGMRSGLTVPNGPAQTAVVRAALANAGVAPGEVGYVEAHGTGTALGDPIEAEALAGVFGKDPKRVRPLVLASLKANVGHMESAAGIGGVIKAALVVRHGEIPAHLHFKRENPELRLAEIPAVVPTGLMAWPGGENAGGSRSGSGRRIAGVSSFGSSGTIAHVVIEGVGTLETEGREKVGAAVPSRLGVHAEAGQGGVAGKADADQTQDASERRPYLLFLSAKTEGALAELGARYAAFLRELPAGVELADVCWTAAVGRNHFAVRTVIVGRTAEELAESVGRASARLAAGGTSEGAGLADGGLKPALLGYLAGGAVEWANVFAGYRGRKVTLPTYPFARDRHWVEAERRAAVNVSEREVAGAGQRRGEGAAAPLEADALQFGIMFFNGTERPGEDSYRGLIESARFADAHGFSSVWLPERHFTKFGALYPNPATLHAALARETRNVRLMAGSAVLPLHKLLRLVEEWSVVDNLSEGRAGMSFASGWNPADFALAPEAYSGRQDALFAGIAEARRLWRGEVMTVRGGDGVGVDVRIYPTPVQRELPLWVTAAGNPRTFERAGEIGAHLLTHLLDQDPDELAEKIARYRAARARGGHDPAAGRVTVMLHTFLGASAGEVEAKVRAPFTRYLKENLHLLKGLGASRGREIDFAALSEAEREAFVSFIYERFAGTRALLGTEAACAPLVRRLAAAGVSEIACLLDFGAETEDVLAMLPRLAGFREAMGQEVKVRVKGEVNGELGEAGVGDRCGHSDPCARSTGSGCGGTHAQSHETKAAECFYEIAWRPVSLVPRLPSPERVERWLVGADAGGVGDGLAARLRALGQNVTVVRRGEAVAVDGDEARVVNLLALETGATLEETVALLRATGRGEGAAAPSGGKVWTVTRGAQAAGEGAVEPMGAAQWGLLRVLPVEQPQRWGGLIDLDPARPTVEQIDALLLALTTSSREDQIALRGGAVLAARLVGVDADEVGAAARRRAPALRGEGEFAVRAEGAYLITGGLGGVGWEIARWLVGRGARDLVLVGRSAPDAARQAEIAALEKAGARVSVVRADVGERAEVERMVAGVTGRAIRGVFHAAGSWEDCALAELTPKRLANVWRAKAAGAANLDAVLRGVKLDTFVLCSAFSSVLPAPHQGNYAAANAFLDGLARQRRARGEAAVSIGFGPWSEIGFATTEYGRRAHARLESLGIARFRPEEGIAVIERALAGGAVHVAAMNVDWAKLFAADPAAKLSPLLGELLAAHAPVADGGGAGVEAGRIARALAGQPAERQAALLADELRAVVAAVLRMKVSEVSAGVPWTELGVDSLVALEIKNRLQRETGVEVPLTKLLEGPTARGLAEGLLPQVKLAAMAWASVPASATAVGGAKGEGGGAAIEEVVL